jgi:hypothetical protein
LKKPLNPVLLVMLGGIGVAIILSAINSGPALSPNPKTLSESELFHALASHTITDADWQQTTLHGLTTDGRAYEALVPEPNSAAAVPLINALNESKASWRYDRPSLSSSILGVVGVIAFPLIFMAMILLVVFSLSKARVRRP